MVIAQMHNDAYRQVLEPLISLMAPSFSAVKNAAKFLFLENFGY